ncbi:hypothetical protein DL93DRAFT_2085422 [Clavulina sp. PMI_390]|nr:hypothetical protein DL93DRAFT_2085422 [Clavulina sp. PMI_390]
MERLTLAIINDHADIKDYYAKYTSASGEEKTKFFDIFRWKLATHTVSEELLLHPAFTNAGLDGALKDSEAHSMLKSELTKLDSLDAISGESIAKAIYESILIHFNDEETMDLPELEGKLSETESHNLFMRFDRTRVAFVEGIANPPAERPFATTAALFSTPSEKVREIFTAQLGTAMK